MSNFKFSAFLYLVLSLVTACGGPKNVITPLVKNTVPVAFAGTFSFEQDKPYSDRLSGSDADGDALTYLVVANPQHGTLSLSGSGVFSFIPEAHYVGIDSFAFLVSDGKERSLPAVIDLEITPDNVVNAPSGTFTAIPETGPDFLIGGKARLDWAIVNATSCNLASNQVATSGTALSPVLSGIVTFLLDCSGIGGQRTFSVVVNPIDPGAQILAPTNMVSTAASSNSISIQWQHAGLNTSLYKIERSLGSPANFVEIDTVPVAQKDYVNNGLLPNTEYSYRVRAANGSSASAYSNIISAQTQAGSGNTPPPNPLNLSVSTRTQTRLTVIWVSGGPAAKSYLVSRVVGNVPPANCVGGIPVSGLGISMNGLLSDTEYSMRVCAVGENELKSSGVTISGRTLAPVLPPNPTGLFIVTKTKSLLQLGWVSGGEGAKSYLVSHVAGSVPPADCSEGVPVEGFRFNIGALIPDTMYSMRVCAVDDAGLKSLGVTISERTLPIVLPPNPVNLSIVTKTKSLLQVGWVSGGPSAKSYLVSHVAGSVAPANCIGGAKVDGVRFNIGALSPDTMYSIRVCAVDADGMKSLGSTISERTLPIVPPPNPVSLSIVTKTKSLLQVGWVSGGPSAKSYLVSHVAGSVAPANCIGGAEVDGVRFNIGALIPDTMYSIRVCAVDEDGVKSVGATISERTLPTVLPPNPVNLSVSNKTQTSIVLNWASGGAAAKSYLLSRVVGSVAPANCVGGSAISSLGVSIGGLIANTQYSMRVCAVSDDGSVSSGVTISEKTLSIPPPNPVNVVITNKTATGWKLSWVSGGAAAKSYLVARALGFVPPADCLGGTPISGLSYNMGNMISKTTYSLRICAVDADGVKSDGVVITDKTE